MNLFGIKLFEKEQKTPELNTDMLSWSSPYYPPSQIRPYNPDDLVRKKGGLDVYRNMMTDDQVKAVIAMKVNAILSSGYQIEAASEEVSDEEIKDCVEYCLGDGLEIGSFQRSLMAILSAIIYGFSVTEKIFKRFDSGEYSGKIGLKKLKVCPAHSFEIHTDEYNNLVKLRQTTATGSPKDFLGDELKYFIIYTYHADNSDFENHYGVSDLRAAYRPWFSKDMIIKFLNIFCERFGMGIVTGKYPRTLGKTEVAALENMVKNISAKTGFVVPDGVVFEILESKSRGQAQFIETINMYNAAIARSVLVPNMLGFTEISSGTYNLGEKHFDLFMMILNNIRAEIEELVNEQIVRCLVDFNFPNVTSYPRFAFKPLTEEDRKRLCELFINAVDKGVVVATKDDEQYFREVVSFPIRKDDAEILQRPADRAQQQASVEEKNEADNEPDANTATEKEAPKAEAADGEKPKDYRIIKEFDDVRILRKMNSVEKKVNFEKISKFLDGQQFEVATELGKLITKMKDELISTVIRRKIVDDRNAAEIEKLDLKYLGDMRLLWKDVLRKAFKDGKAQAREMLPKSYAAAPSVGNLPPKEALAFFERKAFWLTGAERDYILNKVKPLLYDGIKSGMTTEDVVYNLEQFFEQYEVQQRDNTGKLKPIEDIEGRLDTVVRTNYMDAYNQGNLSMFQEASDIVPAYEYSAILDGRVTDVCSELDGLVFKANNPIWSKITPPNHFNCRSLLIPVLNSEWDGVEDKEPAIWPDKGFGG